MAPGAAWRSMFQQLRNAGQPGIGSMAASAVDIALWDLKARLLGLPLYRALPAFRDEVPVYGSGGFTNYPLSRLTEQVSSVGFGRNPADEDQDRLAILPPTRSGCPRCGRKPGTASSCSPTPTGR